MSVPALQPSSVEQDSASAQAWALLSDAIAVLGDLVERHSDDLEGLARAQLLVKQMQTELGYLIEAIRPHLWAAMGDNKELTIDGIGELKKNFGASRVGWDHDAVRAAIRREAVHAHAVNGDGELDVTVAEAIDDTLALVWDVVSKSSYKATGLRERLNTEPDEFCQTSWGTRKVDITPSSTNTHTTHTKEITQGEPK